MRNLIYITILALFIYSPTLAKGNKKEKVTKSFKFNKEHNGFEVDYLTNNEFKTKVEKKQFWGIIEIIVNFVASWFSTSYGKYNEDTKNETGPYFIFDRGPNAKSLPYQLKELRDNINNSVNGANEIYRLVLLEAIKPTITYKDLSSDDDKKAVCKGASAAKNAAFVYIVGLEVNGTGFSAMSMDNRIFYRDKALNYLKTVEGYQLDDGFDLALDIARFIGSPIAENSVGFLWNWGNTRDFIQYRTKELLMLVQTIDMLEWGFKIDSELSTINVQDIENCKAQIKKKYAIPIHRRCQIPLTGLYSSPYYP